MFECIKYPDELGASSCDAHALGYIMFECGLEGVCVKIIKRSQFEKSENAEETRKTTDSDDLQPTTTNQVSVTTNNTLNLVALLNEAGGAKAVEALTRIGMKKPPTPKLHPPTSSSTVDGKVGARDGTARTSTATPTGDDEPVKDAQQPTTSSAAPSNFIVPIEKNDNGKTSSCVINFKTVWFNFAAPPRAPITRKIDFTRLDWNLLSTASPAITAWMNPSNRLAIKVVSLIRQMYTRRTAVATALSKKYTFFRFSIAIISNFF
jgi:hypothetical protein